MNIFWHELRRRWKGTLIWAAAMMAFMYLCMIKYELLAADAAGSQQMMAAFPDTIKAVFGMVGFDLTTVAGYFGICFIFIAVILAVHGGMLGARLLGNEESGRTSEFLYPKPRSRSQILTSKLLAGLVLVLAVWLATVVSSVAAIWQFADLSGFEVDFGRLMTAALLVQLMLFAIGLLASCAGRACGEVVASLVIGISYALFVAAKLSPDLAWLESISVFGWFDALDILTAHTLATSSVALSLGVKMVAISASYWLLKRRDIA